MFTLRKASPEDSEVIAKMVKELTDEIVATMDIDPFHLDLEKLIPKCGKLIAKGKYIVFLAEKDKEAIGLITLAESYALYAEGEFGIIQEFYVKEDFRSQGVGKKLTAEAIAYGKQSGWKRLEVNTPPLPQWQKSVDFYQRKGFSFSGGRKLRFII